MCQPATPPATRTFTAESRYGPRTVESPLTDAEAIATIATIPDNSFAADLVRQHANRGGLSARQMAWVHILACEHAEKDRKARQGVEALVQDELQMDGVLALLKHGGAALKYPKIRLRDENSQSYKLSLAGERSKNPGSVNVVTDGGVWLGRISTDGLWFPGRDAARYPGLVDLLVRLAADPAGVTAAYGLKTGNCSFCGLGLTDERSLKVGRGPVCSANYGLPWGEK